MAMDYIIGIAQAKEPERKLMHGVTRVRDAGGNSFVIGNSCVIKDGRIHKNTIAESSNDFFNVQLSYLSDRQSVYGVYCVIDRDMHIGEGDRPYGTAAAIVRDRRIIVPLCNF